MSLKRQDIIDSKNALRKQYYTKQIMTTVNKGLVLLSATAVLTQVATHPTKVEANDSVFTTRVSKSTFLSTISEHARAIAASNNLYASVMIAQAALESGWGNSTLAQAPYNNLFGIKGSYNGNSVDMNTLEDDGTGSYYGIVDSFKMYPSIAESLADYADVIIGTGSQWRAEFYSGARYSNTTSYKDATAHLTGRYATDTRYGSKLNQIIEENNLTQYDMIREGTTPVVTNPPAEAVTPPSNGKTYRVVAGDTYWSLAKRFGVTVAALQSANNATNSNLLIGMTLNIPVAGAEQGGNETTTPEVETPVTPTQPEDNKTETPTTSSNVYIVKSGDTFWSISKKYGTTVANLYALNGTTSSALRVGQAIKVPGQADPTTKPEENNANQNNNNNSNNGNNNQNNNTPTPTPTQPTANTYTVKAGDTYWALAQRFGTTVASLQQLNGTTSSNLSVGQSLKVPSTTTNSNGNNSNHSNNSNNNSNTPTKPVENKPTVPSNNNTNGSYVVKAGDTYWAIANRYNTTVANLQSLNNAASSLLSVGQTLVVPTQSTTVTTPTVTAPTENKLETVTPVEEVVTEIEETVVETPTPEVVEETITEDVAEVVQQHTVKAGETLYSISKRYNLNVYDLIAQNGGTVIRIGQVISW